MTARLLILGILLLGFGPDRADAGAWPREQGSLFATAAIRLAWSQDIATWTDYTPYSDYRTIYLEYGLTPRWTIGLDLGRSVSGAEKAIAFARLPVLDPERGPKASVQLGFGQIDGAQIMRPGLSFGLGHPLGWLALDGVAEIAPRTGDTDYKLDATLGINLPRERKAILQLQMGAPVGDPDFIRFAPSLVTPVLRSLTGPRVAAMMLETGVTWGLEGDDSMGIKLGLWAEF